MTTPQHSIGSGFGARSTAYDVLRGIDLSGRTAIVTGGSSGLGLETTRALAAAGAHVVVPARRRAAADEAVGALDGVTTDDLDLSDLGSVRDFAERFVASGRTVDIVINSAGIMACPETRVGPGWEAQFATNHLGHYALVNHLRPAFADSGVRVIAVSSSAHDLTGMRWDDVQFERGYDRWQAYGQAKTANVLFAVRLDTLGRDAGVRAFALHPGSVLTPLQRHLATSEMVEAGWIDAKRRPEQSHLQDTAAGRGDAGLGGDLPSTDRPGRGVLRGLRHRRARLGRHGRRGAPPRDRRRTGRAAVGPVRRTHRS